MKKYISIFCTLLISNILIAKTNSIEVKALVGVGGYLYEKNAYAPIISSSVTVYRSFDLSKETNINTFGINIGTGLNFGVKLSNISSNDINPTVNFTPFISTELHGKVSKDFRIYGGIDFGLGFETEKNKSFKLSYLSKIHIGTVYKNKFTTELGIGYPGTVSLGIGARFGI